MKLKYVKYEMKSFFTANAAAYLHWLLSYGQIITCDANATSGCTEPCIIIHRGYDAGLIRRLIVPARSYSSKRNY